MSSKLIPAKVILHRHSFYPNGRGIAICWDSDLTLMYKLDGEFVAWHTGKDEPETTADLDDFLNESELYAGQGTSGIGSLNDMLDDMPDQVLAGIYLTVVGYNPFEQDENARQLVVDYLHVADAQTEIFN